MKRYLFICGIYCFCLPLFLNAQKVKTVKGTYDYLLPENQSIEEGKRIAVERAKLQALADEFGTLISQLNTTVIEQRNATSSTQFSSLGSSEVKGEWLQDSRPPVINILSEQNQILIHTEVWGKARALSRAPITFTAQLLRNGTEAKYESLTYKADDNMYLLFRSPIDGYLSVYLVDNFPIANILLPYPGNHNPTFVRAGKEYCFFSPDKAERELRSSTVKYKLTATQQIEYNRLYLIFSPNKFYKSADEKTSTQFLPSSLSYEKFDKWLFRTRNWDPEMQVGYIDIRIEK